MRRGFFFPLLLIAFGAAFLLSNFGLLGPLSWGALLQLWPLILILIGIDLLVARRAPLLALALELGVVALGVALVLYTSQGVPAAGAPGEEMVSVDREGGDRALALRFAGVAGTYRITATSLNALVDAHTNGGGLRLGRVVRTGERAQVDLEQVQPLSGPSLFGSGRVSTVVDVNVPRDVSLALDITAGAGTFTIDLRDGLATEIHVSTGAGTLRLVLPRASGDVPVQISSGAGTVSVEVPSGVEARVTGSGGVVRVSSSNPRLVAQGNVAETPGYATARDRFSVAVDTGAGTIAIR